MIYILLIFSFINIALPCCANFSAGFSYVYNGDNNESRCNLNLNYDIYLGKYESNTSHLRVSFIDEYKLKNTEKIEQFRVQLKLTHPDKKLETLVNGSLGDLSDNILIYNPSEIKRLKKLIAQYETLNKNQQQYIEKESVRLENYNPEKEEAEKNHKIDVQRIEIFKSLIESRGASYQSRPEIIEMLNLMKELKKEYDE